MKKVGTILALAFCLGLTAHAQLRGVTAEIVMEQTDYLPGEDMRVRVRVTNRSGEALGLGQTDDWVDFSIQGGDGFLVPKTGQMPAATPFSLPAGMMASPLFNPTPYFDIRQPGHYTISATIKLPQWSQKITTKPASFSVSEGVPVPGVDALQFGLAPAPDSTNTAPESRSYSLVKTTTGNELMLYFRLLDSHGKTLRCFRLAPMTSFSVPEAQLDKFNNLHVLSQIGAREFIYDVLTPGGDLLIRQTYVYTDTRPALKPNDNGNIAVKGGVRRYDRGTDVPPSAPESARQ